MLFFAQILKNGGKCCVLRQIPSGAVVGEEVVADAVQSEGGGEAAGFVNEGIQGDGGLILVAEAVVVHPVAAVGLHRPDHNKPSVRNPFKGGFVQNDRGRKPAELLVFWEIGAVDAGEIEDMAGFIYNTEEDVNLNWTVDK